MNIILTKGSTKMTLARPDVVEPYYRGTRFDRSGVVLDLESGGHSFVSQWFLHYDPNEIILNGLTSVSTDFRQMGETAARMILDQSLSKVKCDFRMIRRGTF